LAAANIRGRAAVALVEAADGDHPACLPCSACPATATGCPQQDRNRRSRSMSHTGH
jgi:hypothetical protein